MAILTAMAMVIPDTEERDLLSPVLTLSPLLLLSLLLSQRLSLAVPIATTVATTLTGVTMVTAMALMATPTAVMALIDMDIMATVDGKNVGCYSLN